MIYLLPCIFLLNLLLPQVTAQITRKVWIQPRCKELRDTHGQTVHDAIEEVIWFAGIIADKLDAFDEMRQLTASVSELRNHARERILTSFELKWFFDVDIGQSETRKAMSCK
jgi:hypothetical protein